MVSGQRALNDWFFAQASFNLFLSRLAETSIYSSIILLACSVVYNFSLITKLYNNCG